MGTNCIICNLPFEGHLKCTECGYSECDQIIHQDHHLYPGTIPKRQPEDSADKCQCVHGLECDYRRQQRKRGRSIL